MLILARDEVLDQLGELIVVPATRTIRGIATEVVLAPDEGMPVPCALNFDHVSIAQKGRLGPIITELPSSRWGDVRNALLVACGFGER